VALAFAIKGNQVQARDQKLEVMMISYVDYLRNNRKHKGDLSDGSDVQYFSFKTNQPPTNITFLSEQTSNQPPTKRAEPIGGSERRRRDVKEGKG
jgi:hypothetical protein